MDTYPLLAAVYGRLTSHDASKSLTWAQEHADPALPFGRVLDVSDVDDSAKGEDLLRVLVQVSFFAGDGRTAREGIAAADAAIMDASADAMTGGYTVSASSGTYAVVGRPIRQDGGVGADPADASRAEGARPTRHAYRRYLFLYQKTS